MQRTVLVTDSGDLVVEDADGAVVWRIGFAPDPWAWTPWQYAENGRFTGRWDDPAGVWRSLYVGHSRLACYLEVLAGFRPDPRLAADLDGIEEDPADAAHHPTAPAGSLPTGWAQRRRTGRAELTGTYVLPADARSLPTLRARFLPMALRFGLPDLDAGVVRLAEPRAITQAIAAWSYQQNTATGEPVAGVGFESRHGDDQRLWAVFERHADGDTSGHFTANSADPIDVDDLELQQAMQIHRLLWVD